MQPIRTLPRRYVVTFTDWTAYRLEIEAESADQAIERAQDKSTGDLWELAEARDGGQENWEAVELPQVRKGGAA